MSYFLIKPHSYGHGSLAETNVSFEKGSPDYITTKIGGAAYMTLNIDGLGVLCADLLLNPPEWMPNNTPDGQNMFFIKGYENPIFGNAILMSSAIDLEGLGKIVTFSGYYDSQKGVS